MAGIVIDLAARRAEREARLQRQREEAFEDELKRRLRAFLDGRPFPATGTASAEG